MQRIQGIKKAAALFPASDGISGFGIITRVSLSRVHHAFVIQSGPQPVFKSEWGHSKKTLRGFITRSVIISNIRQPGRLSLFGFRPKVLRRHLSVTLPFRIMKSS
jgi:hypothetical protein